MSAEKPEVELLIQMTVLGPNGTVTRGTKVPFSKEQYAQFINGNDLPLRAVSVTLAHAIHTEMKKDTAPKL